MRRPAAMRIILPLLLLVAAGCVPAMSKAFIRDEDLASLRPDTSATCIVGAHIYMTGELMGVTMRTADGELTTFEAACEWNINKHFKHYSSGNDNHCVGGAAY